MKKILIVLPLYNDWKSAEHLLNKINRFFFKDNVYIQILIVNDNSSEISSLKKKKYSKIKKIETLNLKENVGSQKAIFIGLKWILKKKIKTTIVVMDSDGEDDYSKLKELIKKTEMVNKVVFAKRTKRRENIAFLFLNQIRLFVTFIITGKYLNIGNFSAFSSKLLNKILSNNNISIAYCSGVIKNLKKVDYCGIKKSKRYFGNSKVNTIFIIKHSINLISVFYKEILLRSIFFLFGFSVIFNNSKTIYSISVFVILINLIFIFSNFINISKSKKLIYNIKNVVKIK